jgi:hypothetical protein
VEGRGGGGRGGEVQNQAVNVRVSCMTEERESKPLSSFLQV